MSNYPGETIQLAELFHLHLEILYLLLPQYKNNSNQKDRQDNINELLHSYYKQGKRVVRLKSGDPYIYGRAAEEARYLKKHRLPFEVIPGISAALAAANSTSP